MKVLIVDDNRENRYMLETLLRGNGYEVATARNGEEAIERLRDAGADLIVSDILMPGMDGFQLCRVVRSDEALKGIPFVFYSATYTDPKDLELGLRLGADRFLVKPMDPEAIVRSLGEVIARRSAPPQAADDPSSEEMDFLRRHNEALCRKLEHKVANLERANREMEREARNREQAEQALRESERRFREAVEFLPIPVGIADQGGRILFYNQEFTRRFGYAVEDTPTIRDWMSLAYPDPAYRVEVEAQWGADVALAIEQGSPSPVREYRIACRDGSRKNVEIVMVPVGELLLASMNDVTTHRDVEEQLRQAQKMEALGAMAGGVAHDFNNVLTVILGCSSLLKKHLERDTKDFSLVNEIVASVERAAEMTGSLLAFSRKQVTHLKPDDLNRVVSTLERSLRRLIREDIEFHFARHDRTVPVLLDRSQMEQVIVNLVVNARDAMPSRGVLSIAVSTLEVRGGEIGLPEEVRPGKYGLLTVSDTGGGMDRETQKRIFEPFFTTKEPGKGTGLGLSIVYGIVARHGGYIHVYSEEGCGTSFRIYLPLASGWEGTMAEQPETEWPRGNATILLVEDEEAVRRVTGHILEERGYRVLPAPDGEAGLSAFREHGNEIGLIVSDLVMPRLNGRQMYEEIRRIRDGVPVIFMSGYPDDIFKQGDDFGGKAFYLQKPVKPSQLLSAAHDLISGSGRNPSV